MSCFTGILKNTICDIAEVNVEHRRIIHQGAGFFLCIEDFSMETWCDAVKNTEPFCIVCTGHKARKEGKSNDSEKET